MKTFTIQQSINARQLLEDFINNNIKEFNNLGNSEVQYRNETEFSNDEVDYLKLNDRFSHNEITIYYSGGDVCIENMKS